MFHFGRSAAASDRYHAGSRCLRLRDAGQDLKQQERVRIRGTKPRESGPRAQDASIHDALKGLLAKVSVNYFVVLEGFSRKNQPRRSQRAI